MKDASAVALVCFVETVQKNRNKYRKFILRFVHNWDAAEELVSDGIMRLLQKQAEVDFENIEAYFYTVLKHASLDWLRKRQTQFKVQNEIYDKSYRLLQYDLTSLDAFDPNLIFTREIQDIMHRQLNKMPELTRRIFLDNRFNDLSYDQIAGKYAIPSYKVENEIRNVLSKLRNVLRDYLLPKFPIVILWVTLTVFRGHHF